MQSLLPIVSGISIALLLSWLIYILVLKNSVDIPARRTFLLGSLFLCVLIPALTSLSDLDNVVGSHINGQFTDLTFYSGQFETGTGDSSGPVAGRLDWPLFISIIYFTGVIICFSFLVREILTVLRLRKTGTRTTYNGNHIIIHHKIIRPFSFFGWIFVGDEEYEKDQFMMQHEQAHIDGLHSWDNLFTEIFKVLLWFHPVIWLYKKYLSEIHEFLADRHTVQVLSAKKSYAHYLLSRVGNYSPGLICLGLSNKLITKRIIMLSKTTTTKSNNYLLLLLLPLSVLIFTTCSLMENEPQADMGVIEEVAVSESAGMTDFSQYDGKRIRQVIWKGASQYSNEQLINVLGLRPGDVFYDKNVMSALSYHEDADDLSSLYMDRGYMFCTIEYGVYPVGDEEVNLSFTIYEGEVMEVGSVCVFADGEKLTSSLLDYIDVKPGEVFSRKKLISSSQKLADATGDQNVNITPKPYPDLGIVDIEFTVNVKN